MTQTTTRLEISSCVLPEHEAVRLMMTATGMSRTQVLLGVPLTPESAETFGGLVERRLADEPLQYIEGSVDFGPVSLAVDDRVLIPRPETEQLLERAIALAPHPRVIVDLCTGSGNLAISLSRKWPDARVLATDISEDAVAVAQANVSENEVSVDVLAGDLFSPLPNDVRGSVDLIVSNPPYLSLEEYDAVPADVRAEPWGALVSGPNGDEILARIAGEVCDWLRPSGIVVCEISEFHGARMSELFGAVDGLIEKDLAGKDRFVVGSRSVE
jgi:release factor glutamine methyltransferase